MKRAAAAELVGFVLHALDGTKLTAASSTDQALHRKSLEEQLKRLDAFLAAYMQEVSTRADDDAKGRGYAMPPAMADDDARRAKIRALLERRLEDREDERLLATTSKPKAGGGGSRARTQDASRDDKGATAPAADASKPATRDEAKPSPPPPEGESREAASPPPEEPKADPLLGEAEARKKELTSKLAALATAGVDHLHVGEPEARLMKGRGGHALGYNAQIVVDHDSDLIVACDVVPQQNDLAQLVPMLDEVRATLGRVAEHSVADAGYASGEQLQSAEAKGLTALVTLREEPEAKGAYSKAYFHYDAERDVYVCPRDEPLVKVGTNKSHATTLHPDVLYRCHNTTCPVRAACTKDPKGRKIRRPYGEEARERQAQKQLDPRMRVLLGLRKEIVEHLFGVVKAVDGFRRFTVRGLEKARAQWALVCMAVNLRKLCTAWRQGKLLLGFPKARAPHPAAAAG